MKKKTQEKKSVRLQLFELLVELNAERDKARVDHNDGKSDPVYYGAGAKIEVLDKVITKLIPIAGESE